MNPSNGQAQKQSPSKGELSIAKKIDPTKYTRCIYSQILSLYPVSLSIM